MSNLDVLFIRLDAENQVARTNRDEIEAEIQATLSAQYNDRGDILRDVAALDMSVEYTFGEGGDICRWTRLTAEIPEREREYFATWLSDQHCAYVDFESETLTSFCGDCIVIQDSYRASERGTWVAHKQIINWDQYYSDDRELNAPKLAWLIEQYMERVGEYSDVLTLDPHGNLSPFATQALAAQYVPVVESSDDEET